MQKGHFNYSDRQWTILGNLRMCVGTLKLNNNINGNSYDKTRLMNILNWDKALLGNVFANLYSYKRFCLDLLQLCRYMICFLALDPCSSNPCQNGTCNSMSSGYTCACFSGYSGKNCDKGLQTFVYLPVLK